MSIKILRGAKLPFRFQVWWHHIIPPILGVSICLIDKNWGNISLFTVSGFLVTLIFTASFGYFINDWTDIEVDRLGRKPNKVAPIQHSLRYIIGFILLLGSGLPWIWLIKLPYGSVGSLIWLLELVILIIYSVPPIRLKNRAFLGIICDALYGHILPIGIATSVFCGDSLPALWTMIVVLCIVFFKGLRNIIIHQIQDRIADHRSNTHTFVLSIGAIPSVHLVNKYLLPLEIVSNLVLGILLYVHEPIWLYSFLTFLFFYILLFDLISQKQNFTYNRFWYFLNHYYEGWFPYLSVLLCVWHQRLSFFWFILWIVVFYKPALKFVDDLQKTTYILFGFRQQLIDTIIKTIRCCLVYLTNWLSKN